MLYPFPAVRWNILAVSYINWEISDKVPQNDDQLDPNPEFRSVSLWPIYFAPCLLISIIKSTKWRFLSSLFINRSFNTFRSIQCEQFKEKLGVGVKLIVILRHIIAYFSINIRWHSQNVSSDIRKWLIKHLFPPSSCKKQINKQNSYLLLALLVRFRSGIRYAWVQAFFARSVCTQWKRTTDNVLQILLQASRWRVKPTNSILQIPWKKVKSYASTPKWRKNSVNSQCKAWICKKKYHGY